MKSKINNSKYNYSFIGKNSKGKESNKRHFFQNVKSYYKTH